MYHTWFFQKRLARDLGKELIGLQLLECFSQQKDEMILSFADKTRELHIKADMGAQAGFLSFQKTFARAKRNSVDLFSTLLKRRVVSVDCFRHERSFYVQFEHGESLVFKMHGTRSNILRIQNDQVAEIFRSNLVKDWDIIPSIFGNQDEMSRELMLRLIGKKSQHLIPDNPELSNLVSQMEGGEIYLAISENHIDVSLFPIENSKFRFRNAVEASNKYAELNYRYSQLEKERANVLSRIQRQIKQSSNYVEKTSAKLKAVLASRNPEEIGHLIMANLHQIPSGSKEAILDDLYLEGKISIKLNPRISPQKNAKNYYRKSKNRKIEVEKLEENITNKKKQIEDLAIELEFVKGLDDIKEVRNIQSKYHGTSRNTEESLKPYHEFHFEGWQIMVGKNAKSNDELTQRIAKKNDLWLHARDVSGSHVIVRERAGMKYPNLLIEKAAALAAYYSKRKSDSLCPVIYTPKKYVRKLKGAPAGQVVVDREEVVLIEPKPTL